MVPSVEFDDRKTLAVDQQKAEELWTWSSDEAVKTQCFQVGAMWKQLLNV